VKEKKEEKYFTEHASSEVQRACGLGLLHECLHGGHLGRSCEFEEEDKKQKRKFFQVSFPPILCELEKSSFSSAAWINGCFNR